MFESDVEAAHHLSRSAGHYAETHMSALRPSQFHLRQYNSGANDYSMCWAVLLGLGQELPMVRATLTEQ